MRRAVGVVLVVASLVALAACAREAEPARRAATGSVRAGRSAAVGTATAGATAGASTVATRAVGPAAAGARTTERTVLPSVAARVVFHGPRTAKRVALTFDLCATPGHRATLDRGVLRSLQASHAKATFMMGGLWAEAHPREAALLGHDASFEIGNHSLSHPHMTRLSLGSARRQVLDAQRAISRATGRVPRVFRFPYEERSPATVRLVASLGLIPLAEDVISGDPDPNVSAVRLERSVVSSARAGSIVIMHANGNTRHTAAALPGIIAGLRARGFDLVTVSELLAPR